MRFRLLSLSMATVACGAQILISAPARMNAVRARLVVLMTIDAFKCAVVRLVCMAVGAGIPSARAVMAPRTDGEPLVVREKSGGHPGKGAVTCCTIGVEICAQMSGIGGCRVFPQVARHTFDGSSLESVPDMTRSAGQRCVNAPGRKIGVIVIE